MNVLIRIAFEFVTLVCPILINGQTCKILDFSYSFNDLFAQTNVQNNSTLEISYVGHKRKVITFTGKFPPQFNVTQKSGKGIAREEYFYDLIGQSQYFDLSVMLYHPVQVKRELILES